MKNIFLALIVVAAAVGAFAIFHGHAHGTELPAAANPTAYSVAFVMATCLLHLGGIGIGLASRWPAGDDAGHRANAATVPDGHEPR